MSDDSVIITGLAVVRFEYDVTRRVEGRSYIVTLETKRGEYSLELRGPAAHILYNQSDGYKYRLTIEREGSGS